MARILLIHHDKGMRTLLEAQIQRQHQVTIAKHVEAGVKELRNGLPDLVVVGHDAKAQEGARLLRYLKENAMRVPVVVVVARGGTIYQEMMTRLGARGIIEYPGDVSRLNATLTQALGSPGSSSGTNAYPPPMMQEELTGNLSILETQLNKQMKCFAGKNQVFIYSLVGGMRHTRPRICLKCPLRAEYGLNREVYFEFIRDTCCSDPQKCEAVQKFTADRKADS